MRKTAKDKDGASVGEDGGSSRRERGLGGGCEKKKVEAKTTKMDVCKVARKGRGLMAWT